MIVEGFNSGKALFTYQVEDPCNHLCTANWDYVPYLNSLAEHDPDRSGPCNLFSFNVVNHAGCCGYNAVSRQMGLRWKDVFRTFVRARPGYFGPGVVNLLEEDSLDSRYWMTSDISKLFCGKMLLDLFNQYF